MTFGDSDSVTAVLTTTQVDGGKATWEITQAKLTKDQVIKRVAATTGAKSVDCDAGLDGREGKWVDCRSTVNGYSMNQTVEIAEAKGLLLKLKVTPFITVDQVQEKVSNELISKYGRRPDQTVCNGPLLGVVGNTIKCLATLHGNGDTWSVTVTDVSDGLIGFVVAPLQSRP